MSKLEEGKSSNRRSIFPEGAFNVRVAASDPSSNAAAMMIEDNDDVVVGNSSDEATPVLEVMIAKNSSTNFKSGFPFPSKWDDAEKWLKSGEKSAPKSKPAAAAAAANAAAAAAAAAANSSSAKKKNGFFSNSSSNLKNHAFRKLQMHRAVEDEEECEEQQEESTKKMDVAGSMARFSFPMSKHSRLGSSNDDEFEECEMNRKQNPSSISAENFDFTTMQQQQQQQQQSPTSIHDCLAGTRAICMRDMGTEMTPIASQEPSRTGTPTMRTPTMRSPGISPAKIRPIPPPPQQQQQEQQPQPQQQQQPQQIHDLDQQSSSIISTFSTRAEIFAQLSKNNSIGGGGGAGYSIRSCEDMPPGVEAAQGNMPSLEEVRRSVVENRAAAWEEAELAKHSARYEREEAKIIAWENHEKAKAEAELRKMEVKVERMRSYAHEQLMNKLAATRRRAEERRAAAEAKKCNKEAEAATKAQDIRRTGRTPAPSTNLLKCCLTSS